MLVRAYIIWPEDGPIHFEGIPVKHECRVEQRQIIRIQVQNLQAPRVVFNNSNSQQRQAVRLRIDPCSRSPIISNTHFAASSEVATGYSRVSAQHALFATGAAWPGVNYTVTRSDGRMLCEGLAWSNWEA